MRYPQRLRSVVTRQEIRAPRLQLRHELFRKLKFDFRLRFSKYPQEPGKTEWRSVLHDFRVWRIGQFFCFSERVVQFTETIYEFVLQCFFARENSPISDRVAEKIGRQVSLLCDDAEKFVVRIHNEVLYELPFLRRDRSRSVQHVFEFAALKNYGCEADFVKQLLVIQGLNDYADAPGDCRFISHQKFAATGNIISARGRQRIHVDDNWFLRARLDNGAVDLIGSRDFSAGRVDLQHNGLYAMVLARLLKCCSHVVHHRVGDVSRDRRADQAAHGDNRYFVRSRAGTSLKQDLAETRDRFCFL